MYFTGCVGIYSIGQTTKSLLDYPFDLIMSADTSEKIEHIITYFRRDFVPLSLLGHPVEFAPKITISMML